jgi:putative oxidoreductase
VLPAQSAGLKAITWFLKEVIHVETGLLLLRVMLGALLIGHGFQKTLGWFHGPGLRTTASLFENWGFRPGQPMVVLAASCEVLAGSLLIMGLGTPLAAAITIGTMAVAAAPSIPNGLWAARGGFELPLVYAVLGAVIALTGPGSLSIDSLIGVSLPMWSGAITIAVGVVGSAVPLWQRRLALRDTERADASPGSRLHAS